MSIDPANATPDGDGVWYSVRLEPVEDPTYDPLYCTPAELCQGGSSWMVVTARRGTRHGEARVQIDGHVGGCWELDDLAGGLADEVESLRIEARADLVARENLAAPPPRT